MIRSCSWRHSDVATPRQQWIQSRMSASHIALEDIESAGLVECLDLVKTALRIVEAMPGVRVGALHRTDPLGGEQDVVYRHHLSQQEESRQVVYAGVEEHALHRRSDRRGLLLVDVETAVAAPGYRGPKTWLHLRRTRHARTACTLPAPTAEDLQDPCTVVKHADRVGLSFARGSADVQQLQHGLAEDLRQR